MAKRRKVVKYRRPISLNIGIITFGIIFVYLVFNIGIYMKRETLSTYEVTKEIMQKNISTVGIALRNESLVDTNLAGYINYYIRDGERVAKNATVYSIDETGRVYEYLAQTANEKTTMNSSDYKDILNMISVFSNYYNDDSFSDVYEFKYDLNNTILELTNESAMKNLEKALKESGITDTFKKVASKQSGIVTYNKDGYEDITKDTITAEMFDSSKYNKEQLKTGDLLKKGTPVYKLTRGESWDLIIQLTEDQKNELEETLEDSSTVKVTFAKDNMSINANAEVFEKDGDAYARLTFSSYLIRYLNDRFLDVEITLKSAVGLKIPNTALVEKEFYRIPIEYLSSGNNQDDKRFFNLQTLDKKSEIAIKQVSPTVYRITKKYCYISVDDESKDALITGGSILMAADSNDTFQVGEKTTGKGVYCVNQGYADFRIVQVLYSNDDYSIIQENVANSLSLYDYIILNSSTAKEDDKIY